MSPGKVRTLGGEVTFQPFVDLIFFDIQENLPVPKISNPPNAVPKWNADPEFEAIQEAFDFAEKHLHDHGCMVLFHPWSTEAKGVVAGLCNAYPFVMKKDWLGINRIHLTSPLNPSSRVCFSDVYFSLSALHIVFGLFHL